MNSKYVRSGDTTDLSRDILDSLTAEVAVLDADGTIVAVNEAWRQFARENGGVESSVGVGVNYFDVCHSAANSAEAELAELARIGIQGVLEGAQQDFTLEYPCHSATQSRWFLLHATRLKTEQVFAVTTHVSITERKLAEEKLLESERLAAIGEAMRGLSHEGRNALQRAQANIELLSLHIEGDAEAQRILDGIAAGQARLIELYEQVQHYATPLVLNRQRRAVNQLVEAAWSDLKPNALQARFNQIGNTDDLLCDVDAQLIRQLFRSILQNSLSSGAESPEIEVRYIRDRLNGRPAVTVIVRDNGPGIPAKDRQKIFKPFYTTKLRGTGLGLAMGKRIVVAHGGCITVDEPHNGGFSLSVTLPENQT